MPNDDHDHEQLIGEDAFKQAVLQDIGGLINMTSAQLSPGAFERIEIYARAGALIERGPQPSRADLSASLMPMVQNVLSKVFNDSASNSKARLFDELHQLVHTREIVSPTDKESIKLIDARIAEIRRELGPEHEASVVSIVPPAAETGQ